MGTDDRIKTAEKKVTERLKSIEHAEADLAIGILQRVERSLDETTILQNRTALCMLGVYHLRDDARGLARVRGGDKSTVDSFADSSCAISLCIKAGDTYKHGVGGRTGNNTVMNYCINIHDFGVRAPRNNPHIIIAEDPVFQEISPPMMEHPIIGSIMLVIDEHGEAHQSNILIRDAMRDWLPYLRDSLGVDVSPWIARWLNPPDNGLVTYSARLPESLEKIFKLEAEARRSGVNLSY